MIGSTVRLDIPPWIGRMTPWKTWLFLASAVAMPAVSCLIAGWVILDARVSHLDTRIADAKADLAREIGEKTDGGKLQSAVAALTAELKGLSELPGKVDVLTQSVSGARLDIVKAVNDLGREVSAVKERSGSIESKLDGFRERLDETKGDVRAILQRATSLGRPDPTSSPIVDFILVSAPESQKKVWESGFFKIRDYLPKASLVPVYYQRHFLVRADESTFSRLLEAGFERFSVNDVQPGEWPLAPGLYVKVRGAN